METKPFIPNNEQINLRKQITPFGRAEKNVTESPVVVNFKLCIEDTVERKVEPTSEKTSSYIYRPPVVRPTALVYKMKEFTVRVTNIPVNVSQKELFSLLTDKARGLFMKCHLVFNKETNISKGVAYLSCSSMDNARNLAKKVRDIVIDGLALGAEVLNE